VASESLSFPILARDEASSKFRDVGRAALDASGKIDIAAASLKVFDAATIKSGKAADTSTAAMKTHRAAALLFADAENVLAGKATVTTKLMADQGRTLEDAGKSAEAAAGTGGTSGLSALIGAGGAGGGGMAGLIATGVALSPVLATLTVGTAGLGLAALGASKNTALMAQVMAPLKSDLAAFDKSLQPQVLGVFNQGVKLAGHLLGDVQPVAKATGTALGGLLGAVDKEFRSQTWQQFFSFMSKTAGPDVTLLQGAFVALLDALPPLVQGLQPVAVALLTIVKDGSQALDILTHFPGVVTGSGLALDTFHTKATAASGSIHLFSGSTGAAVTSADRGTGVMSAFGHALGFVSSLSQGAHLWLGLATGNIKDSGQAAAVAGPKFFSLNQAVAKLNTSMQTLVGNLLTLQGGNLSWKQSLQAAETQLKSNTAGLEGNSKNALANKQAVLASTNAALAFASQELATGKNISGASTTVQAQIKWLQGLHDKSQFVKDELHALRQEEKLLQAQQINQTIHVQGLGQWQVSQSLAPGTGHRRASGGLVPGYGGGDKWPALLEGGEAIVPKHLTPMVAPFLKAHRVPGFAAGGLVPSYSGSAAMAPWVKADDKATIRLIDLAVVKATLAGIAAAKAAAAASFGAAHGSGGPSSGAVSALQRYAASLFGQFGWSASQLGPLIALWNGESGWNPLARNPSSGAFGIPQALPPGKMGALAASGNAAAQIRWGEGYIHSVYGTPANAYGTWLSRSPHWYGGGTRSAFPGLAVVGERGPEIVSFRGGETVTPVTGGGPSDNLLSQVLAELRTLNRQTAAAPGRTSAGLADALNGVARTSRYSGMYSSR
jgi:hypothetical protein